MVKVLSPFQQSFRDLQQEDFRLDGHRVEVFLGGDYHFLDSCLGHQGSSATFPSSKWDMTKAHLQNHSGKPHTPRDCSDIGRRTIEELEAFYNKNLCKDRHVENIRKTGKFHGSIFHRSVFPISTLDNVVPPVLHIMLGIVLKLFNLVLARCREIDSLEGTTTQLEETQGQNDKWKLEREKLQSLEAKCRQLGCDFVDLYNLKHRIEAVWAGNYEDLDFIASASDNHSKRAKIVEHCSGLKCLISAKDDNILWIQCNSCNEWKHGLCELLTQTEEDVYSQSDEQYICLICQHISLDSLMEHALSKTLDTRRQQELIEVQVLESRTKCYQFQETVTHAMGRLERQLNDSLSAIKVERQAFYGDTFVGNHCKLILVHHKFVCSVLDKDPLQPKIVQLFGVFAAIQPYLFTKTILSEADIAFVTEKCWEFGTLFPQYFPHENITRKIHELVFDIPEFISKHKTVGRYSEEEGESLHNSVNQELRRLACVRNNKLKLKLVLQSQELRGKADRSLAVPKARLCPTCKEQGKRSFLKRKFCEVCMEATPAQ